MIFAGWSIAARILAPLAVLAAIAAGLWVIHHRGYVKGADAVRAEWADAKERQRIVDAAERTRRDAAQLEIIRNAIAETSRARADAAAAGAAGSRLRDAYAAALKRCTNPPAAAGSAPAASADDVLAYVQRRIDEAAGELAKVADDRGTAGRACERAYETLTEKAQP